MSPGRPGKHRLRGQQTRAIGTDRTGDRARGCSYTNRMQNVGMQNVGMQNANAESFRRFRAFGLE